jgi:hypothetical protein
MPCIFFVISVALFDIIFFIAYELFFSSKTIVSFTDLWISLNDISANHDSPFVLPLKEIICSLIEK